MNNNMNDNHKKVVTRFAPSPTGFMHVGNVRSALFAYLWTRKNKGTYILRIEDTDKVREVPGSIEHIIESLEWLGIDWDEGMVVGGPHAPYKQSDRLDLYNKYAQKLIEKGLAYPDPYTNEEVESFRKKAEEEKRAFLFREHRPEKFDVWDGTKPLRFKVPEIKSYSWHDEVFGDLSAGPEALDDFILIKSDGYPTYNFAHIVDDIEMGITLVMRGQEYISSTPRYLSVYESMGIKPPLYACLPHIMATEGNKKMGKRDGAKDLLEYRAEGYLPEAMINFLALIGWNPGTEQEVFSKQELIDAFDLKKIQNAGGGFNDEKLDWLNKEHIKKMNYEDQEEMITKFLSEKIKNLPQFSIERLHNIVPIVIDRIKKFGEVTEMCEAGELDFFFSVPNVDPVKLIWKKSDKENTILNLNKIKEILNEISNDNFTLENIKEKIMAFADALGDRGSVLHPMRFSLTGLERSPDPFTVASVLGKNETLSRIEVVVGILK